MRRSVALAFVVLAGFLSGCATWSHSSVDRTVATAATATSAPTRTVSAWDVAVTEGDITDRPYDVLGKIDVTVNKTTAFHPDPTRAQAELKLREAAAVLGADAVIFAWFDPVTVSLFSWGSLDAGGTAVRYQQ